MSPRILLRLDSLRPPLTGIGYYTFHLLKSLLDRDDIDEMVGVDFRGIKNKAALIAWMNDYEQKYNTSLQSKTSRGILAPFIQKTPIIYNTLKTWIDLREQHAIFPYKNWIYHEPSFIALKHKGPMVVTIHDLSHIRYPAMHPKSRVDFLNKQLSKTLQRADHIITVSHFTRNELLDLNLVQDENRVSVTHLGVDPIFYPRALSALESQLSDFKLLPQQYLLAVGTLEPRKNLSRLLRAYDILPDDLKRRFPLVLTGPQGWKNAQLLTEIQQVRSPGKIILTGYLSREKLAAIMSGAAVFVFPSLYEGFGLPVLEAMASGTAVISANHAALKEICGDAAVLIDPLDIDEISDKMKQLLEYPSEINTLKEKSIKRVQSFSWKHCADLTVKIYQKVAAQ